MEQRYLQGVYNYLVYRRDSNLTSDRGLANIDK